MTTYKVHTAFGEAFTFAADLAEASAPSASSTTMTATKDHTTSIPNTKPPMRAMIRCALRC